MTPSEVIGLALTRSIRPEHIKESDIALARARYVDAYLSGTINENSAYYTNYVKPVIAYGVIVDIWPAISVEVTDRGVQQMLAQGATQNKDSADSALQNYSIKLSRLIDLMQRNAPSGVVPVGEYSKDINIANPVNVL